MKRADVKAGQEYLACTSNDWSTGRSWRTPTRVRVISTERLVDLGYGYSVKDKPGVKVTAPDGTTYTVRARKATTYDKVDSVVVIRLDRKTGLVQGNAKATLMATRELRATWPEGKAILDDLDKRAREAQEARDSADKAKAERLNGWNERMVALGLKGEVSQSSYASTVTISTDDLVALLATAEEGGN